jgi:hypothetical protein
MFKSSDKREICPEKKVKFPDISAVPDKGRKVHAEKK